MCYRFSFSPVLFYWDVNSNPEVTKCLVWVYPGVCGFPKSLQRLGRSGPKSQKLRTERTSEMEPEDIQVTELLQRTWGSGDILLLSQGSELPSALKEEPLRSSSVCSVSGKHCRPNYSSVIHQILLCVFVSSFWVFYPSRQIDSRADAMIPRLLVFKPFEPLPQSMGRTCICF